jgi:hypothetical protein
LKAPKQNALILPMPPLKAPKQKIIVPTWVEDAVREAIDRDGGIYRDRVRVDNLAAQIGAAEAVVRRSVKVLYEEMEG